MTDRTPDPCRGPKRFCLAFDRNIAQGRVPKKEAVIASIEDTFTEAATEASKVLTTVDKQDVLTVLRDDDDVGFLQHYHCDACKTDITNHFRVRCGECTDFDLCISCFAKGVETGTHKNNHPYIPIGRNSFSIFTPDWNADEEVMLLEGISKYGFGNWSDVAELVAPHSTEPKTKEQCEQHYHSVHIRPFCEPDRAPTAIEDEEERRIEYQRRMIGKYYHSLSQPIKPSSVGNQACNIVGYMPLRGEFEVEYDNDAELILSDLEFQGDEIPVDRELKLKVADIYNARVDERILRKKAIIEKGLVDWRRVHQLGRKKHKEELDLLNLFRLLARYDLSPDYEELASLFLAERKLRQRVEVLNEWRSLGLKTFKDVEVYEKIRSSRLSGLPLSKSEVDELIQPSLSESPSELSHQLEAPASHYPGAHLLTEQELEMCESLQIPPIYFIITKYSLLNAFIQQQHVELFKSTSTLKLDASKQGGLYDFILHSKLNVPPAPAEDKKKG